MALRPKMSDSEWIEVLEEELNEYRTLEEEAVDAYDQISCRDRVIEDLKNATQDLIENTREERISVNNLHPLLLKLDDISLTSGYRKMTVPPRFQRAIDVSEARVIAKSSNQKMNELQTSYDTLHADHAELQSRAQKDHIALQEEKAKNDVLQSEVDGAKHELIKAAEKRSFLEKELFSLGEKYNSEELACKKYMSESENLENLRGLLTKENEALQTAIAEYVRSNEMLTKEEASLKEKLQNLETEVTSAKEEVAQLVAEKQDINEELLGRTEELEAEQQAREDAEASNKKTRAESQRQKTKIRKLEQTIAEYTKKMEEQANTLKSREKEYQELIEEKNRSDANSESLINQLRHELETERSVATSAVGEESSNRNAELNGRINHGHIDAIHDLSTEVGNLESNISGLIVHHQNLSAQKDSPESEIEKEYSSLKSQFARTTLEYEQQQEQLSTYQMKLKSAEEKVHTLEQTLNEKSTKLQAAIKKGKNIEAQLKEVKQKFSDLQPGEDPNDAVADGAKKDTAVTDNKAELENVKNRNRELEQEVRALHEEKILLDQQIKDLQSTSPKTPDDEGSVPRASKVLSSIVGGLERDVSILEGHLGALTDKDRELSLGQDGRAETGKDSGKRVHEADLQTKIIELETYIAELEEEAVGLVPRVLLEEVNAAIVEKDKAIKNLKDELSGQQKSSFASLPEQDSDLQEAIALLKEEVQKKDLLVEELKGEVDSLRSERESSVQHENDALEQKNKLEETMNMLNMLQEEICRRDNKIQELSEQLTEIASKERNAQEREKPKVESQKQRLRGTRTSSSSNRIIRKPREVDQTLPEGASVRNSSKSGMADKSTSQKPMRMSTDRPSTRDPTAGFDEPQTELADDDWGEWDDSPKPSPSSRKNAGGSNANEDRGQWDDDKSGWNDPRGTQDSELFGFTPMNDESSAENPIPTENYQAGQVFMSLAKGPDNLDARASKIASNAIGATKGLVSTLWKAMTDDS